MDLLAKLAQLMALRVERAVNFGEIGIVWSAGSPGPVAEPGLLNRWLLLHAELFHCYVRVQLLREVQARCTQGGLVGHSDGDFVDKVVLPTRMVQGVKDIFLRVSGPL